MGRLTTTLLIITTLLVLLPAETYAFGAGDIPDFAFLNNKAFRHGDIEEILTELAKTAGRGGGGGGLLGFASSVLTAAAGGAKFSKDDVKKVYFGNWLRDYSQAMDIAGLSKLTADTLVLIVAILGFLTFGFSTEEFEITPDRLGVYLPVEHIDNPKGYAEKEGDARNFHPKLRPPVESEELEIDPNTGMKNYMATENRGWDTSTAHIRRTFRECIEYGRRAQGREGGDLWEAYRLMGSGLHTMEDLLAHSNWCEVALRKLGYPDVFCHVGDNVVIDTPNGPAPPLITGTFGSSDFIHSLLGEASDHLSQASVVDLSQQMNDASQNDSNTFSNLKDILSKLPIGGGNTDEKMSEADAMQAKSKAYEFNPDDVASQEVQRQLLALLKWRDGVYRDILKKIEMVPGLTELIDNLTNALNAYVYTVLAPYLTPILQQVTSALGEGSKAVIDSEDQYEVFDNPDASDPSHSLLSKDHFALILNEPAGKIAQLVVQHSVKIIVEAWFDEGTDIDQAIDQILEAFHHPYYATGQSRIQEDMYRGLQNWVTSLEDPESIMQALTKESVREGQNKRQGSDDDMKQSGQTYGAGRTNSSYGRNQGRIQSQGGDDYPSQGSYGGGGYGESQEQYGRRPQQKPSSGRDNNESPGYGGRKSQYQSQETSESYGGGRRDQDSYGYGRKQGRDDDQHESGYGSQRRDDRTSSYGASRQETYGSGRQDTYGREDTYGRGSHTSENQAFGSARSQEYSSGRGGSYSSGGTGAYGSGTDTRRGETGAAQEYYSGNQSRGHRDDDDGNRYGSGGNRDDFSSSRRARDEGGHNASFQSQQSSGYGRSEYSSNTSGRGAYGSESRTTFGSGNEYRGGGEYETSAGYGSRHESQREREGFGEYGGNRSGGDRPGYGRQEREREEQHGQYGGNTYGSSEFRRREESSGYGGGSSYERGSQGEGYRSSQHGYGQSDEEKEDKKKKKKPGRRSDDSEDDSNSSPKYGHRKKDDDDGSRPSGGSGYGQGGYGSRSGYGYGGGETYGAERLRLGDDSDDEKKRRRQKKYNDYD